jgi:hypothetical protein
MTPAKVLRDSPEVRGATLMLLNISDRALSMAQRADERAINPPAAARPGMATRLGPRNEGVDSRHQEVPRRRGPRRRSDGQRRSRSATRGSPPRSDRVVPPGEWRVHTSRQVLDVPIADWVSSVGSSGRPRALFWVRPIPGVPGYLNTTFGDAPVGQARRVLGTVARVPVAASSCRAGTGLGSAKMRVSS